MAWSFKVKPNFDEMNFIDFMLFIDRIHMEESRQSGDGNVDFNNPMR